MVTADDAASLLLEAKEHVPRVLRRLMQHYGISAADLAPYLGVTRAAVSARIRGATVIKQEELAVLAVLFGVPESVFRLTPNDALRWVLDHPSEVAFAQSRCTAKAA